MNQNTGRFRQLAAVIGCSLITSTAAASFDNSAHAYSRTLTASIESEALAAIDLTPALWDRMRPGAADLRITDDQGREAPYITLRATGRTTRTEQSARPAVVRDFRELPDGSVELRISLTGDKPQPANRIVLATPLRDFDKRVAVWGLRPDGTTVPLVENGSLFDYSRFVDVRQLTVDLPENTFTEFKLRIDDGIDESAANATEVTRSFSQGEETSRTDRTTITKRPFRIDSVALSQRREVDVPGVERSTQYPVKSWTIHEDADRKATIVSIETSGEPLTGFELLITDGNFSRTVTAQLPVMEAGREPWRDCGQARIHRMAYRAYHDESIVVSFPEQPTRRCRLVIDNQDNPALAITNVVGRGPQWQAVILASPGRTYQMHYGAPALETPRYDTDHIRRILSTEYVPAPLTPGPERPNPNFKPPRGPGLSDFFKSRNFFIAAVIVMVLALGLGLARAVKNVDSQPSNDG